jgi:hypothetical protein
MIRALGAIKTAEPSGASPVVTSRVDLRRNRPTRMGSPGTVGRAACIACLRPRCPGEPPRSGGAAEQRGAVVVLGSARCVGHQARACRGMKFDDGLPRRQLPGPGRGPARRRCPPPGSDAVREELEVPRLVRPALNRTSAGRPTRCRAAPQSSCAYSRRCRNARPSTSSRKCAGRVHGNAGK